MWRNFRYLLLISRVSKHPVPPPGGDGYATTFRSIVNLCHNLSVLVFTTSSSENPYECLKALDSNKALLPNIKKIDVVGLYDQPEALRTCHLWVNLRFCPSISSLYIVPASDLEEEYGGIVEFVSNFKHLAYLKVAPKEGSGCSGGSIINLSTLVANHKDLKIIKLYCFDRILIETPSAASSTTTAANSPMFNGLRSLKIMSHTAAFELLDFITEFKNLTSLRFIICTSLIPPKGPIGTYQHQMTIKKFEAYHEDLEKVRFRFDDYLNDHYFKNRQEDAEWLEYSSDEEYEGFWMDEEDIDPFEHEGLLMELEEREARRAWIHEHIDEFFSGVQEEEDDSNAEEGLDLEQQDISGNTSSSEEDSATDEENAISSQVDMDELNSSEYEEDTFSKEGTSVAHESGGDEMEEPASCSPY